MPDAPITPKHLDLDRAAGGRGLTIEWSDGRRDRLSLGALRVGCPCAACRENRRRHEAQRAAGRRSLSVLPGNFTGEPAVASAELVGRYALKLAWSDGHTSGIYSFAYLRDLAGRGGKD